MIIRIEEKDITDDEIENASFVMRDLLQADDPLIKKTIDWFKEWYDPIREDKKIERIRREEIETELRGRSSKRKEFYRAFRDNCQDKALRKDFSKTLKEFM